VWTYPTATTTPSRITEKIAVKTTIVPTNAVVVVLEEGVHDRPQLPCCSRDRSGYFCLSDRLRPRYPVSPDTLAHPQARGISRAEPLASWDTPNGWPRFKDRYGAP